MTKEISEYLFEVCTNLLALIINMPEIEKNIGFLQNSIFYIFFQKKIVSGTPLHNGVGLQKSTYFCFEAKIVI